MLSAEIVVMMRWVRHAIMKSPEVGKRKVQRMRRRRVFVVVGSIVFVDGRGGGGCFGGRWSGV